MKPVTDNQASVPNFRQLNSAEIKMLEKAHNRAENWNTISVSADCNLKLVQGCYFSGWIKIGPLSGGFLESEGLRLPIGLCNSALHNTETGRNVALKNVHYISNYRIGDRSVLFNIDELTSEVGAVFGNGAVPVGSENSDRLYLEICNENGGRKIAPFSGMLPADGFLWSQNREDNSLMQCFDQLTDQTCNALITPYGQIGDHSVIKSSRIIKNTNIGSYCRVSGANRLENLTIQSSQDEPTVIGEGVELLNGVIGYNNKIVYGVKTEGIVTGRNVKLSNGARILQTFVGDNSTISCCEVLSNLIFPFHEQHHNNSFLIAAIVGGQDNIAAGATIGSNHNSRAADGEIIAARGFWPGLVTNFKHNSIFAPFTIAARGNYDFQMNIKLPFSLISPGKDSSALQLMPGYWFKYNMYALARNAWKFAKRDRRKIKEQNIETDFLAPDTIESVLNGIDILREGINRAAGRDVSLSEIEIALQLDSKLDVHLDGMVEKSTVKLIKPAQGVRLYKQMVYYYGARELLRIIESNNKTSGSNNMIKYIRNSYQKPDRIWHNVGGQIISESDLNKILSDIKDKKINEWREVHKRYDLLWNDYPRQRSNHGLFCLLELEAISADKLNNSLLINIFRRFIGISDEMYKLACQSRAKDFENSFRLATYKNKEEMNAVLTTPEEDSFLADYKIQNKEETANAKRIIAILESMNE